MLIFLGDDQLDFAREQMPYIPNAEVHYFSDAHELVAAVRGADPKPDLVITDLNYTMSGEEGYYVLAALQHEPCRCILWTGNADEEAVVMRATSLGAQTLDKRELGTLAGLRRPEIPLKQGGRVLVFQPGGKDHDVVRRALKQVLDMLLGENAAKVSGELEAELLTGEYGLVIDLSTIGREESVHGTVAHDLKYLELAELPRVICMRHTIVNVVALVTEIQRFNKQQELGTSANA